MARVDFSKDELKLLSTLIKNVADRTFPDLLRTFLNKKLTFSTFLIVIYSKAQAPQAVFHWIPDQDLDEIYETQYLSGSYFLDPYYQLSLGTFTENAHRLSHFAPDRFFSSEYYRQYYEATALKDEVGFLSRLSDTRVAHLSITRSAAEQHFDRRDLKMLDAAAPLICQLIQMHCEWLSQRKINSPVQPDSSQRLDTVIYKYAKKHLAPGLTRKEALVTSLILLGHSSPSASLILGNSPATTKVHRRNIYRKLNISSQAQLFATFSSAFSEVTEKGERKSNEPKQVKVKH